MPLGIDKRRLGVKPSDQDVTRFSRRQAVWIALSNFLTAKLAWAKHAGPASRPPIQSSVADPPRHITPDAQRAILSGLNWLASRQSPDGGFGRGESYARNVGVCALCGLAYLSQGWRGLFHSRILECTRYLLAHAQPGGFIVEDEVVTHAPLYGHGFATLYLGQLYGEDRRGEVRDALKRAAALIVGRQNAEGAWRYTTIPGDEDVSITTCQMMALLSARQAGIAVPRAAISRGIDFLRRCQNADGGFRYRLIDPPESLFPRSAAAVATLHAAGLRNDDSVLKGRRYLETSATPLISSVHEAEYYYYGRFYATHAAWQAGEAAWNRWYPAVRDELLERQSAAGNWQDPNVGGEYATAMALIILQFPYVRLPIFLV
jgi:Prenyltransferase and squalene oxidase repeat